jgi:hypothetical protein
MFIKESHGGDRKRELATPCINNRICVVIGKNVCSQEKVSYFLPGKETITETWKDVFRRVDGSMDEKRRKCIQSFGRNI